MGKSLYRGTGGKEIHIFPGSALAKRAKNWVLAGEQVETSQLFARKVANIEAEWLERLGGRLCRSIFSEAQFNEESGIVEGFERVTLHGLTIVSRRSVPYSHIDPAEATRHFIQEALVAERLRTRLPFFRNNRRLKQQLLEQDAKLRRNRQLDLEAAQEAFYSERLHEVGSIHDLNRLLKKKRAEGKGDFLMMRMEDFLKLADEKLPSSTDYPDTWTSRDTRFPLSYQFSPASSGDGVTLHARDDQLSQLHPSACDWLVPGYWEERVFHLLKSLPKTIRRQLVPLGQTTKSLSSQLKISEEIAEAATQLGAMNPGEKTGSSFTRALGVLVRQQFRIRIPEEDWDWQRIPEFLQVRLEVKNAEQRVIYVGRDTHGIVLLRRAELKQLPKISVSRNDSRAWQEAANAWCLDGISNWSFELPREISIDNPGGPMLKGYPGLMLNHEGIERRLFGSKEEALEHTLLANIKLLSVDAGPELAWLERDLSDLSDLHHRYAGFGSPSQMHSDLWQNLFQHLFDGPWIETRENYEGRLLEARKKLKTLSQQFLPHLESLLDSYHETQGMLVRSKVRLKPELYQSLSDHVLNLLPLRFPLKIPFIQWNNLKRYLKAVRIRIERSMINPCLLYTSPSPRD